MFIIYNENETRTGGFFGYDKINANKGYIRHYENSLFLDFMMKRGNFAERKQAAREIIICERKMSYMEKHANFDWRVVQPEVEKLNHMWANK